MAEKNKEVFRTPVSERKKIKTPAGSRIEPEWAMRLDETGKEEFYIKNYTNTWEKIQSYKEECLIENILAACLDTGDMSLLEKAQGTFMDMTSFPATIYDAHKQIKEAEKTFEQLPIEIRKKYNNNFNEFMADFGSENWMKNLQIKEKEEIKETENQVKENTNNE